MKRTNATRSRRWGVAAVGVAALLAQAAVQLGSATPAAAALPGYTIVSAVSAFDSVAAKSVTVPCPGNTRVIGTGYDVIGSVGGEIVVTTLRPTTTGVTVAATEDQNRTTASWSITAQAVCANQPAGHTIASFTTPSAPASDRTANATCPTGRNVIGAGFAISNSGSGQISMSNLAITANTVFGVALDDEDGFPAAWSLTTYAICANPLPGWQLVAADSAENSSASKTVTAACPAGKRATGQGWVMGGNGEVFLNDAVIFNTGVTDIAFEDDDGYAPTWSLGARVICATS
jgi:hypothetical protein